MTIEAGVATRQSHAGSGTTGPFSFPFRVINEADVLVVSVNDATGLETELTITDDYTVSGVGDPSGGNVTTVAAVASGTTLVLVLDPVVEQPTTIKNVSKLPGSAFERALDRITNGWKRIRDLVDRALTLTDGSVDGSGTYDANSNRIINLGAATGDNDAMTQSAVQALIAAAELDGETTVTAFSATVLDDADAASWLTTLGVSAFVQTMLNDATDADVLGTLGLTAFSRDLVQGNGNAEAWHLDLLTDNRIPKPNLLDNSDFQIWQMGTSFTLAVPATNANDDDSYTADRWKLLVDAVSGSDIVDVDKGAVNDVPAGAVSSLKVTQNVVDTKWGLWQTLEQEKCERLASLDCSLGISIKAPGTLKNFKLLVVEWQGTGDAPTSDPISSWGAAEVRPTLVANWAFVTSAELDITVSGSGWERFELEGFAMPASPNNIAVFLCTNDPSFGVAAEVSVSAVKLEIGDVCTPYESKDFALEFLQAQRFYATTFAHGVFAENGTDDPVGAIVCRMTAWANGTGNDFTRLTSQWRFPVEMLKTPTITWFNPSSTGTDAYWRSTDDANELAVSYEVADRVAVHVGGDGNITGPDKTYRIHAEADGRL